MRRYRLRAKTAPLTIAAIPNPIIYLTPRDKISGVTAAPGTASVTIPLAKKIPNKNMVTHNAKEIALNVKPLI